MLANYMDLRTGRFSERTLWEMVGWLRQLRSEYGPDTFFRPAGVPETDMDQPWIPLERS